jgi:4-hydroxybenzoate polyprenyltransferase
LKALSFIIHSNILIALAALALTLATQIQLGMSPQLHPYLAAIFLATLFDYNLHRYLSISNRTDSADRDKLKWSIEHPYILNILIITSFIGIVVVLFFLQKEILYLLIPLAVLSFLYSFPLPGKKKHHFRLLQLTGMKTLLIAGVWSGATVLIPVYFGKQSFDFPQIVLLLAERFTFIFAIAIPFDIRDMKADSLTSIKTIPIHFGENNSLKISNLSMLVSLFIATFHYINANMLFILPAYIFSIVLIIIFINNRVMKNLPFYYHGILDGCILLHAMLVFLSFYVPVLF